MGLQCVQRWQQHVTKAVSTARAAPDQSLGLVDECALVAEYGIDGLGLACRCDVVGEFEVSHQAVTSFSTRIAAALNSAVPERLSQASLVITLTSTSSGKWNVVKVRPSGMST